MRNFERCMLFCVVMVTAVAAAGFAADRPLRLKPGVENVFVRARVSGNLEAFDKGIRGAADHMIFDMQRGEFLKPRGGRGWPVRRSTLTDNVVISRQYVGPLTSAASERKKP